MTLTRPTVSVNDLPPEATSFIIGKNERSYKHQFANIYFIRLRQLRCVVEERAANRWKDVAGLPTLCSRVLDVQKGKLCYIVGTVYMDMPLKPNILNEIGRDRSIPPPPPPKKYRSADDVAALEDESGRISLVGERLARARLITGIVMGVLGAETASGDFEVIDICFPGLAPQMSLAQAGDGMETDDDDVSESWVALVSALDIGATNGDPSADARIQMLIEFLSGESSAEGFDAGLTGSQVARLIVAGDSIVPPPRGEDEIGRHKKPEPCFSTHPTEILGDHLLDLAHVIPIHLMPGPSDPAAALLPQQPMPRALFGEVRALASFTCETNPSWFALGGRTFLGSSGQPVADMSRYVDYPPLSLLCSTLEWRHLAPTAPDTLWCYPFMEEDPFILSRTPDVYFAASRDCNTLETRELRGEDGQQCRVILLPPFSTTGFLTLVSLKTLEVRAMEFGVHGMRTRDATMDT